MPVCGGAMVQWYNGAFGICGADVCTCSQEECLFYVLLQIDSPEGRAMTSGLASASYTTIKLAEDGRVHCCTLLRLLEKIHPTKYAFER